MSRRAGQPWPAPSPSCIVGPPIPMECDQLDSRLGTACGSSCQAPKDRECGALRGFHCRWGPIGSGGAVRQLQRSAVGEGSSGDPGRRSGLSPLPHPAPIRRAAKRPASPKESTRTRRTTTAPAEPSTTSGGVDRRAVAEEGVASRHLVTADVHGSPASRAAPPVVEPSRGLRVGVNRWMRSLPVSTT